MKLINFILCDDIRNEMGNKPSLMGVYDDKIEFNVTPDMVNTWPKAMRVGIYARIKLEDENISSFRLRILYDGKVREIGRGTISIDKLRARKRINIAVVHSAFPFDKPCTIQFFYDFLDVNNELIETLTPESTIEVKEQVIE